MLRSGIWHHRCPCLLTCAMGHPRPRPGVLVIGGGLSYSGCSRHLPDAGKKWAAWLTPTVSPIGSRITQEQAQAVMGWEAARAWAAPSYELQS